MDGIIALGMVLLAAFAQTSLQADSGCLVLLHHACKRKYSKNKRQNMTGSFIVGVGVMTAILLTTSILSFKFFIPENFDKNALLILTGITLALAILILTIYYRRGRTTKLWISRRSAEKLKARADGAKNDSHAFLLGMIAGIRELVFSFIPIVFAGYAINNIATKYWVFLAVAYMLIILVPLISLRAILNGENNNFAEVQKWRVKNKNFIRIISCALYMILALFVYGFGVK